MEQPRIQARRALGRQIATGYHPTGRTASHTWPDGLKADYTYDPNQGLQSVTLPEGTISVTETRWNTPTRITYPGGTQRTIAHDLLMRPTAIQVRTPGQTLLLDYHYRYDAESNITGKSTEHGDYAYQYDELYRLTAADNAAGLAPERYTYDPLGNRASDNNGPGPWRYNLDNQLLERFDANGQPIQHHYDANGSLTQKDSTSADPRQQQQFSYDAANRLIEARDAAGQPIAAYQYDPYGRRIRKTQLRDAAGAPLAQPRTTWFIYADEGLIAEADAQGTITTQYGWTPGGTWSTAPLFIHTAQAGTQTKRLYPYHNDHLGTPQAITDQNGAIVWQARAQAFGKTTVADTAVIENPLRFPGQYEDVETGTHYNYFRDYEPEVGRYVQWDPIGLDGGKNAYGYAENNPIMNIDSRGLQSCFNGGDCMGQAGANLKKCLTDMQGSLLLTCGSIPACALFSHPAAILACLTWRGFTCAGMIAVCMNRYGAERRACSDGRPIVGYEPTENYWLAPGCDDQCYSVPDYKK